MKTKETKQERNDQQALVVADQLHEEQQEKVTELPLPTRPKKGLWPFLFLVMLLVMGYVASKVFTSVARKDSLEEIETTVEARLPVRVIRAQSQPIEAWVFSYGNVDPVRFQHLTFEVEGEVEYIKKINGRPLREGDFVRQGELLARVDQRKLASDVTVAAAGEVEATKGVITAMASLQQSQASVRAEQANLATAMASLAQAKADMKKAIAARNLAETEMKRYQRLWQQGVVSASDRDRAVTQFQDAEAAVEAAEAGIISAQSQIRAAQASLEAARGDLIAAQAQVDTAESAVSSAKAQLKKSNVILEDTVLRAPFDGIVAYLNIREGQFWSPQRFQPSADLQSIVETVPIIVIDPRELEVELELPAFDGAKVRPNVLAYIVLEENLSTASVTGLTQENLVKLASAQGRVFAVNPAVNPGDRGTKVRIRVTQGVESLRVGARVAAWIVVDQNPQAVVVPRGSLVFRDRKAYAFVVNESNNTAVAREVKLGIQGLAGQEIKDGVYPGELVVTEGKNRLVNGSPIKIVKSAE